MPASSRLLPFYDSLSDGMFRRDVQGREIFYPAGFATTGRIVDDAELPRLRTGLRRMWIVFTLALGPVLAFAPGLVPTFPAFLAVMALEVGGVVATTHILCRELARLPAGTQVSPTRAVESAYANPRKLITMFTLSVALAGLNASILFGPAEMTSGQPEWLRPVAAMGILFFLAASLAWLRPVLRLLGER